MNAVVYKSTGSWYVVKDEQGKMWNARIKGVFKIDDINSTNPIAVGDKIEIEPEANTDQYAIIKNILPRHNYINRQAPHDIRQHHIVASNISQSLLLITLLEPRTSQGYIDRYLVASEAYHIPTVLVFNKCDLYRKKENEKFGEWKEMYESIGYTCYKISITQNEGVAELKEILKNKISLVGGHSGVGKTSLINYLMPDLNLKVQNVSGWSSKGMHTTSYAEMYDLPFGGNIIDIPGMREFGLTDFTKQELSHYFPEMRNKLQDCKFKNCLHINEPDCAIKNSVAENSIHPLRYNSYCNILNSIVDLPY